MTRSSWGAALGLLLWVAGTVPLQAAEPTAMSGQILKGAAQTIAPGTTVQDAFGSALEAAQLDSARAQGAGPAASAYGAISDSNLSAVNSGNAINAGSVTSGAITLQSGTFSGFSGLGNFVINSGNNNNLQGSLNLSIVMVPGKS